MAFIYWMQISQLYISPAVAAAGLNVNQLANDIKEYMFNLSKDNTGMNQANNVLSEQLLTLPIDRMSDAVKTEVIELLSSLNNRINYGQPEQNRRAHKNIDSYIKRLQTPNVENLPAMSRDRISMPAMAPEATAEMGDMGEAIGGRARKVSCGCRRGGRQSSRAKSRTRSKSRAGSRRGRPRSKLRNKHK